MYLLLRISVIVTAIIFCFISGCRDPDNGSMQPYECYPLIESQEEIKQILKAKCLDTIQFRPGQIIADIGAGNGYLEGMLSVYNDSLTFYIQDIDTSVCNQDRINEVVNFYQEVRGHPITNNFIAVIGTDSTTNLPDSTFDKILMLWTYPYIKKPASFFADVRLNLRDQGFLYVINPGGEYDPESTLNRDYGWNISPIEQIKIRRGFFHLRGRASSFL